MTWRMPFVIVLLLASAKAFTQPLVLEKERLEVKSNIGHFRDATGTVGWPQIQQKDFAILTSDKSPNFGFDRAVYWFKFDVVNESQVSKWLLEIGFSALDKIDFYYQTDSTWVKKTAGDLYPIAVRDVHHQHPIFTFNIPPGETRTIYLRVKTASSLQLPAVFWQHDAFFGKSFKSQIVNGLFYGAMMVMILYHLFLFISAGDRITFYYVLTLLSMSCLVAFFQGYTFLYLYPTMPWINRVLAIVLVPVFITASTLLTRSLLSLGQNSNVLDTLLVTNMVLDILSALLMLVLPGKVSLQYHHYFVLSHSVLALVSAGYCMYLKYHPAVYYMVSWVTLLLSAVVFSMSNLGLFPKYITTHYTGLMMGCILQMLFIALALGDRWKLLARENALAKELELKRGQEENERLEREVKLRTEEIQHKTEKLEEVNRVKDKLFSVVSHDIKGPLTSLQLALALTKTGTVTPEEFKELATTLELRFVQTTEFIENLLQWATLQLKAGSFDPTGFDLSKLSHETVELMSFDLARKGIRLVNALPPKLMVYADMNMIRSVMRNLLTNAIKFTSKGGVVTLEAEQGDKFITILVRDTGVGIPSANRNRIFSLGSITTPGTKQEKGTGLGLLLCKEFVELNNGHIWFESEEGKGTTFYFSLPEFQEVPVDVANKR